MPHRPSEQPPSSVGGARLASMTGDLVAPVFCEVAFGAFRADAVAEVRCGMLGDIVLDLLPLAVLIPDILAVGADREDALEHLHPGARGAGVPAEPGCDADQDEQHTDAHEGVDLRRTRQAWHLPHLLKN